MKLLFLLLIASAVFGQDSSNKLSLLGTAVNGRFSQSALTVASFKPIQSVYISWDTCLIGYFKSVERNADYNKPASWSAWANSDTVIFHTPPKKIIVGDASYTSMLLNGHWYLMMDPEPIKSKK